MCRARVTRFLEYQVRILHSRAQEGLTSPPLFLHTGNHCCVVSSYDSNIVQPEVLEFLKGQMTALVPDSLMCNLLLEGTRFPLQCVLQSENPTLLDASVRIEEHI